MFTTFLRPARAPDQPAFGTEAGAVGTVDLLAGYYLCKKKGLVPQEVTPFQRTLMQGGTYNRSSTQFHGTPNQRGAAMDRGFMYAMDGKSLQEAARDGAEYVLRLLQ
jgi:hypothetical protein